MSANLFGPDLGIVIVVILVVLLGGSQLPKIARNVGTAGKEFRKAQQEAEEDAERERAAKAAKSAPAAIPAGQPATAAPEAPADESITLTPAQLEAMLKAREEQARNQSGTGN